MMVAFPRMPKNVVKTSWVANLKLISVRSIAIALGLLSVLSVAANAVLFSELRTAFGDLHFSRVFPLGYVKQNVPDAVVGKASIAFYGDSRADTWAKSFVDGNFTVINLARGAKTSSQLLLQLEHEQKVRSNWAMVQIGINDIHPIGAIKVEREMVLANLQRNLADIVESLLSRSDRVLVSTIVMPGRVPLKRLPMWDAQSLESVKVINEAIRQLARQDARTFLVDASALLGGDGGYLNDEFVDSDFFLHLNTRAYDVLNASVVGSIDAGSSAER